jgi:purine-binding chemotaxis protein CheW
MGQLGQIVAEPSVNSGAATGSNVRVGTTAGPDGSVAEPALVFRAGTLLCAVRLAEVIETMRPLPVHRVADAPAFVSGLCILRGRPAPVVDVALLLTGVAAEALRFVAVRTERGLVALATGTVIDVCASPPADGRENAAPLGPTAARLVAGVGTVGDEPLFQLRSMRILPDEMWDVGSTSGAQ